MSQVVYERSKKIKLTLSYDGTEYGGWQRQKGGKPTIQGEVEAVLQRVLSDDQIRICGSGRTDAGVHAYAQVAHFWAPEKALEVPLVRALNGLLPKDITVSEARWVCDEFHAIASSEKKTYIYKIYTSETPMALRSRYSLWRPKPLNKEVLTVLSQALLGTHDFQCFQTSGSDVSTTVRTLLSADWSETSGGELHFSISGSGFLKQMVRTIVGTLLEIHDRGGGPQELLDIIASCDRRCAYRSAPARALFLKSVQYPQEVDKPLKILN